MDGPILDYVKRELEVVIMLLIMIAVHVVVKTLNKKLADQIKGDKILHWVLEIVSAATLLGALATIIVLIVFNVWIFIAPLIFTILNTSVLNRPRVVH